MNLFDVIKNDKPSARIPYDCIYCPRCKKELINYYYDNRLYKVCPAYDICNYYYIKNSKII